MKLSIVTQEQLCYEQVMSNHNSIHRCYIVEVPDDCFPKEVLEAYKEMYESKQPKVVISNCWTCNPET